MHADTHQEEDKRTAAVDAMRLELEAEQRAFDAWLQQPCDDPNPNRWRQP